MIFLAPEPLDAGHQLGDFDCGVASLNEWPRKRALANNKEGASRTYVVAHNYSVVGFYSLSASSIAIAQAVGRFRLNMPDPVPVVLLGRLAIDLRFHSQGLGRAMFRDGALRVITAAATLGIRGMIVHAISDEARSFYLALGFEPSPLEPMTLMVTLADLKAVAE